jgi:hypothetical membrane protein
MSRESNAWIKMSGILGIAAPVIAFTCTLLSISFYQSFSWTANALSDLGVENGFSAPLFNFGLILSGILALLFVTGLFKFMHEGTTGRVGAFILGSATIALTSIGIFPENVKLAHYFASVAFFVIFPISMFAIAAAFMHERKMKMGLFTIAVAIIAGVPWIIQFVFQYFPNVAIPETISALSAAAWAMVQGFNMQSKAARQRILHASFFNS